MQYHPPMNPSTQPAQDTRIQPAQAALCKVARRLFDAHGQHQFYTLPQVQEAATQVDIDRTLMPWVFAGLVQRTDFDAYYSLRDVPGDYRQLRTDLSRPSDIASPDRRVPRVSDDDFEDMLESLLDLLDLAADANGIALPWLPRPDAIHRRR